MFVSTKTVFRSKWRALVWSAGICLTAWCTVPREEDGEQTGLLAEATRIAAEAAAERETPRKANPWALPPGE